MGGFDEMPQSADRNLLQAVCGFEPLGTQIGRQSRVGGVAHNIHRALPEGDKYWHGHKRKACCPDTETFVCLSNVLRQAKYPNGEHLPPVEDPAVCLLCGAILHAGNNESQRCPGTLRSAARRGGKEGVSTCRDGG